MIKAVIIGFAHMHVNEIAQYIDACDDFQLIGFADVPLDVPEKADSFYTRAWNIKHNSEKYNLTPHDDYRVMLDELHPDMAFILCDNANKPEIVQECAQRGVHVSIEKPMAVNLDEALKIKAIAEKYDIEAIVNWPLLWRPYLHKQIAILNSGIVGKLIKVFYINGHTGPLGKGARHRGVESTASELTDEQRASTWWYQKDTGGGAFLDIGCYGCLVNQWARPEGTLPVSVCAFSGNYNHPYMDAPDNMAAIVEYSDSYGVIEGGWTVPQPSLPTGPVYCCSDGVIYCNNREVVTMNSCGEILNVPEPLICENLLNLPEHYAYCKKNHLPLHRALTLDFNIDVMRVIDAGLRSAASGKKESL